MHPDNTCERNRRAAQFRLQNEVDKAGDAELDPYTRLRAACRAERMQEDIALRDSTCDWNSTCGT